MSVIVCRPRSLPVAKLARTAKRSLAVNPANSLELRTVARTPIGRIGGPRRLAVLRGRKWKSSGVRLTVEFLDAPEVALRKRILLHMNAWAKTTNTAFVETRGAGTV